MNRQLSCGALAGPAFLTAFSSIGRHRAGYDARRHSVSSLALGPRGVLQRVNFILTGSMYLTGSIGLARTRQSRFLSPTSPALIAGAGIGLIGSGVFNTDPASGYPPRTPPQQLPPSRAGALHNLCAIPIFAGIPAAALLSARAARRAGDTPWTAYSSATAIVMAATAALFGQAFAQQPDLVASGGLLQRISIASGFGWLTALHVAVANSPSV